MAHMKFDIGNRKTKRAQGFDTVWNRKTKRCYIAQVEID